MVYSSFLNCGSAFLMVDLVAMVVVGVRILGLL